MRYAAIPHSEAPLHNMRLRLQKSACATQTPPIARVKLGSGNSHIAQVPLAHAHATRMVVLSTDAESCCRKSASVCGTPTNCGKPCGSFSSPITTTTVSVTSAWAHLMTSSPAFDG